MARIPGYRLLTAATVLLVGVGVSAVFASPAAAVPGLVKLQSPPSASDSTSVKSARVMCPAGTRVMGGGADIIGGGHSVFVSRLVPFITTAGDGFFVLGSEDTAGTTNSWSITAYALCAPDPGGWELIYGSTLSAPGETDVSAEADCTLNAGKKVIGAGGGVIQDGRNIVLDDVMPLNDLRGVSVELMHDETPVSPDAMYTAFAYAICINALPTQQLVTTMTDAARGDRTAVATCPSFTELHGAGGALSGAYGEAHIDRIGISGAGGISAADIDARTDWNGTTSNWRAWAYAICA